MEDIYSRLSETPTRRKPSQPTSVLTRVPAPVFRYGFFTKEEIDTGTIRQIVSQCTSCHVNYTHHGHANTDTLRKHVIQYHYSKLSKLIQKAHADIEAGNVDLEDTILATPLALNCKIGNRKVPDLYPKARNSGAGVTKPRKNNRSCNTSIDKWVEFMIECNVPFDVCDRPSARRFFKSVNPQLEQELSLTRVSQSVGSLYRRELIQLRKIIAENPGRFSLAIDERETNSDIVFVVTLQYLDDSFGLEDLTIGFFVFEIGNSDPQTAMMPQLSDLLSLCGLNNRIIAMTHNNSVTMNALAKNFADTSPSYDDTASYKGDICSASHILGLSAESILHYTFFKDNGSRPFVSAVIDIDRENPQTTDFSLKVKSLPGIMRNIVQKVQEVEFLKDIFQDRVSVRQLRENSTTGPETLLMDNATSWVSTFNMINRFLYFRNEVDWLLSRVRDLEPGVREELDLDDFEITGEEWEHLSDIHKVLSLYYEPTTNLQASKEVRVHMIIPFMYLLLNDVKVANTVELKARNPWLSEGLKMAREKLFEYYPITKRDCPDKLLHLYLATVLDPRLKLTFFKQKGFSPAVIDKIRTYFEKVYHCYKRDHEDTPRQSEASTLPAGLSESGHSRLSEIYGDSDESSYDDDEVATYLYSPKERRKNIVEFYMSEKYSSPVLYQIAKDFLAMPAILAQSAPSAYEETIESITENKIESSSETKNMLAFIKYRRSLSESKNDDEPDENDHISEDPGSGSDDGSLAEALASIIDN